MVKLGKKLVDKGIRARHASRVLARVSSVTKDKALSNIADALNLFESDIILANAKDVKAGREKGLSEALIDRLLLDKHRIRGMANGVRSLVTMSDPIGEMIDQRTLPNGLNIGRRRVPIGVIGAIYESRPNVTVDISVLCLKSGNAVILRGGSEAIHSNTKLVDIIRDAIVEAGIVQDAVAFISSPDRSMVKQMLSMNDYIDLLIPRGGQDFIRYVGQSATMPVITGGIGVCHTYVDKDANLTKAVSIAYNAKVQRPTVCNALDTLLVHSDVAPVYLGQIAKEWSKAGVEIHCDKRSLSILGSTQGLALKPATEEDWGREFLSLIAAIKIVDSFEEAIEHIDKYGSGHSEAIVTEDYSRAMQFLDDVDAAAVFVNASTRFTDGSEFGLGAEVAISTNKMHARGPMGLRELTSYKWIIMGSGQIRE